MLSRTLFGLHISKCAGTSFLQRALSVLPRNLVYQNTSSYINWKDGMPEFLDIGNPDKLLLIWGHNLHEEMLKVTNHPILFTGLRDPLDRLRSHLNYDIKLRQTQGLPPLDTQKWLAEQNNPICWFIINRFPTLSNYNDAGSPFEKAKRALSHFHFIFFSDNFENFIVQLSDIMQVSFPQINANVASNKQVTNINIDNDKIKYDIQLYEWAIKKFKNKSLEEAITTSTPLLTTFLKQPVRQEKLKDFLYRKQYDEYKNWNIINSVIQHKLKIASNTISEINFYLTNLNQ